MGDGMKLSCFLAMAVVALEALWTVRLSLKQPEINKRAPRLIRPWAQPRRTVRFRGRDFSPSGWKSRDRQLGLVPNLNDNL
jgi:hypothetical protein